MISIIAYLAHQNSVKAIADKYPQVKYLQATPRKQESWEIAMDITNMFKGNSTPEWAEILDKGDFPHDYFITFGAIVFTAFYLILPWSIATPFSIWFANELLSSDQA
jgi:hypothetical protein